MSTSSSTSTNFSFDNGKYTKTTTTINFEKRGDAWVEVSKTVVIEETDQPLLLGPTVPQQPSPLPSYPPYSPPVYPYNQPYITYCAGEGIKSIPVKQDTASGFPAVRHA